MLYRPLFAFLKGVVQFLENYLASEAITARLELQGSDGPHASETGLLYSQAARALVSKGIDPGAKVAAYWIPGRIEVLGKHTDYAGGASLLAASGRGIALLLTAQDHANLYFHDARSGEGFSTDRAGRVLGTAPSWHVYPLTVVQRIASNFGPVSSGGAMAFASNIPPSAGMSSSSALVIAVALALQSLCRYHETKRFAAAIDRPEAYADYLGHIENGKAYRSLAGDDGVGTDGGSQDHLAIMHGRYRKLLHATFLPTHIRGYLDLPAGLSFCIGCSGVQANKTGAARNRYNAAVSRAHQVLAWSESTLKVRAGSLGALTRSPAFEKDRCLAMLKRKDVALARRLEQFWNETQCYIPGAIEALQQGDLMKLGALVDASQADADHLLGNQVPETNLLVETARAEGAIAASAFGAGFGGAVWALVAAGESAAFIEKWRELYSRRYPQHKKRARFFEDKTGPAAHRLHRGGASLTG